MYDLGGLVRITICVEVWPACARPSRSPTLSNEMARGVAMPASASVPPLTGHVRGRALHADTEQRAEDGIGREVASAELRLCRARPRPARVVEIRGRIHRAAAAGPAPS